MRNFKQHRSLKKVEKKVGSRGEAGMAYGTRWVGRGWNEKDLWF